MFSIPPHVHVCAASGFPVLDIAPDVHHTAGNTHDSFPDPAARYGRILHKSLTACVFHSYPFSPRQKIRHHFLRLFLLPLRRRHAKTASSPRLFGLLWTQLALLRLHFFWFCIFFGVGRMSSRVLSPSLAPREFSLRPIPPLPVLACLLRCNCRFAAWGSHRCHVAPRCVTKSCP